VENPSSPDQSPNRDRAFDPEGLDPRPRDARLAALLTLSGLAVTLAFALHSPEGIHHFDDLTHYLFARWAIKWPAYLLDDWGRPGFTALYFLPAQISWTACRVLSVILTAASAWLAFRIAQRIGLRHAWAVVPLCYAQPLFFQLSQTTLTETTLAFYLTLAIYLTRHGHWSWSAAFVSLGMVTRHEAVIFLPIWLYFAWRQRVALVRLWPLVWAPLVVNVLAIPADIKPPILRLLEPRPSSQYGAGGWLTFFSRSMEAWGPGIMVLAMTGIASVWRRRGGAMIATCAVVYFVAHVVIRALGLFDSGGYARFLVPITPIVAVAALTGWLRLWSADPRRRRAAVMLAAGAMIVLWIAAERQLVLYAARLDSAAELPEIHTAKCAVRITVAVLTALAIITAGFGAWPRGKRGLAPSPACSALTRRAGGEAPVPLCHGLLGTALMPTALLVLIVLACGKLCHTLERPPPACIIDDLKQWLAVNGLADRKILSANIWVTYATGDELPHGRPSLREALRRAPAGTLFAWDEQFAASADHGLSLQEMLANPTLRLIHRTRPAPFQQQPYLLIFEKTPR
jgi:hypothetical protein